MLLIIKAIICLVEKVTFVDKFNNKRKKDKEKREHGESYKDRSLDKQSKQYVEVVKEEQKLGPMCSCLLPYARQPLSSSLQLRISWSRLKGWHC